MPDSPNVYRALWSAKEYLRQYYTAAEPQTDERHSLMMLAAWLRGGPRVQRALEVGCGPVPYRALLLTPHADEIHLADFLIENLAEVRAWKEERPGHHDWDSYLRGALALEGGDPVGDLASRKADLRSKMADLRVCNLTREHPLGLPTTYDLVTSFYCAEAISHEKADWERHVTNLAGLVGPGGRLFVTAVRNCTSYRVFDHEFPASQVNEADWARLLAVLGFPPDRTIIDVVATPEFVSEGFDSVCVIRAVRGGPHPAEVM